MAAGGPVEVEAAAAAARKSSPLSVSLEGTNVGVGVRVAHQVLCLLLCLGMHGKPSSRINARSVS